MNEDYNAYYDWARYELNFSLINQKIVILLRMGYSQNLLKLIKSMLESDEFIRPGFSQLLEYVEIEAETDNNHFTISNNQKNERDNELKNYSQKYQKNQKDEKSFYSLQNE